MLIEFSVTNFRSFSDRQTLSMVAAARLPKKANVFTPSLAGEKFPDLLKVAAIYGPNASGKSNLLRAMDFVSRLANRTPSPHISTLPVTPFAFGPGYRHRPSEFEVHFIQSGVRYSFLLAATRERIVEESLTWYPNGKALLIYRRSATEHGDEYVYGPALMSEVSGDVTNAWEKLTAPTVLFISQAVANSNFSVQVLRAPFRWLSSASWFLLRGMKEMSQYAQELIHNSQGTSRHVAAFLRDLDVPVSEIKTEAIETELRPSDALRFSTSSLVHIGALPAARTSGPVMRVFRTTLTHQTGNGSADIALEDESEGTQNLFGFWLPWITRSAEGDQTRFLLVVDEIDSSLHPKIVEALVERHLREKNTSQLLFTTHDTHLMETKLLRRDQIWLTERDANGATQLRSVHDFKGRESEDVEKRYFEGRYRSLPVITKRES